MSKNKTSRKSPWGDPHAQREAQKYDKPIPSREVILDLLEASGGPRNRHEIADQLGLADDEAREALRRRLRAMERDGQVVSNRRGGYGRVDKMDLIRCRVQGHKDGFGFAIPLKGGEDLFLHQRQMGKVFDGDEVLVRIAGEDYRGRLEGAIVEVLSHNTHQLVGRLYHDGGICYVRPENPRITNQVMIPPGQHRGAGQGQYVVVEITRQPSSRELPLGTVLEVLGDHMAPGMEIDVAIRNYGIPSLWPAEVQAQAAALSPEVSEEDKDYRFDLRDLPLVTIDGEDARDFDDAVFCEPRFDARGRPMGGWRLYVAIADVSHYVPVNSPLDEEAQTRGTSVYFPDFVVPMLPEALSNGLCSLNPCVDRLCMVCEMEISAAGDIEHFQFYEGVMHSFARLTYTEVGLMLDEDSDTEERATLRNYYAGLLPHLEDLHDLYRALKATRDQRGAIEFDTTETQILFDEQRKIERIVPRTRNDAHKLIEECMLAANVCAATLLEEQQLPALYRVHEPPKEEKLSNLNDFLRELGLSLPRVGKPTPKDFRDLLDSVEGRPDAHLIQTVMLRSMNQAQYRPDNEGHFGLAYEAYAHFTSPIRRYPDLLVHRAIRSLIRSRVPCSHIDRVAGARPLKTHEIYPYELQDMLRLGEQTSLTERRADEATRDVEAWLKCEYLQDHIGAEFDGVVSAVVAFGLFVELEGLYVEGLVHITTLPHDYYHFDAAKHRLKGEKSGRSFHLGDQLHVKVVRVDLDERKVDFELVGLPEGRSRRQPSSARRQEQRRAKGQRGKDSAKKASGKGSAKQKTAGKSTPPDDKQGRRSKKSRRR